MVLIYSRKTRLLISEGMIATKFARLLTQLRLTGDVRGALTPKGWRCFLFGSLVLSVGVSHLLCIGILNYLSPFMEQCESISHFNSNQWVTLSIEPFTRVLHNERTLNSFSGAKSSKRPSMAVLSRKMDRR